MELPMEFLEQMKNMAARYGELFPSGAQCAAGEYGKNFRGGIPAEDRLEPAAGSVGVQRILL